MAYMSEEGYKQLIEELKYLESVERPKIVSAIAEARDKGDLSENAEYDAAKEEQGEIESRIIQLENLLRNAEVIDEDVLKMDVVNLGSKVTVLDVEFDEEMEYTIVGSTEADPMNGRISNESPLGMALLGQKVGATVMADTPDGEVAFKILNIQK